EQAKRLSRRHFLSGAASAAGAAILVACGSGSAATNTPAAPTAPATPGTTATSVPAIVASPSAAATAGSTVTANASPTAAPAASANIPKGGALTQTITGTDAKSFHPFQTTDTVSSAYQGYIFGGGSLTQYDPKTLDLVGFAAEKWDLSADKTTVTFTLKDGLKWSDGTPMTTADYVWTYQQAIKPENKYAYVQNFEPIVSFLAKDARTLVVTLNEPITVAVETADAISPLPKHIWEKYDWNDPTKNPEINAPSVGNGMWKLKEWKRDDHAIFVANDLYFDGRPYIDQLTVRIFGTEALAYQALKSGEVDSSGFQPSDYKEAKTLPNVNVYEWYAARGSWSYIGFNLRRPALKDPLVRKAIAYATDRQGIIDSVAYGLGRPIYSAYPQTSPAYNPNVEHYDFDVKKAADLFKQAGYTLNGKKLTKDGQQLSLKLLFGPATSKVREGIATLAQQQLSDLGIALDVQALEFQAFLDTLKKEPFDYDLFVLGWSSSTNPYFAYQIWSESSIPQLNSGAYVNKQVEDLYKQARTEFDKEKQKTIYNQIQKLITDDEPYVFLYEGKQYTGVNKRVGGITPTPRGIAYNMNKWYITK
ncbi:MAG: ABC transporter substrate-binding protein, partial [Chloroflexota bacterium]|nr:ABC transporter substrate-binding protein [Chloroflexota bacterium]